jgi:hypothetical protein
VTGDIHGGHARPPPPPGGRPRSGPPATPSSPLVGRQGPGGVSQKYFGLSTPACWRFSLVKLRFFSRIFRQMKKSTQSPHLTVVDPTAPGAHLPQPARPLGEHGAKLWRRATAEYNIDDVAGVEMLTQACQTLDRAEALAACIEADGEIVRTPQGIKAHPAIREELSCRGFIVRTLQKLGLNFEPLHQNVGRPPGRGS